MCVRVGEGKVLCKRGGGRGSRERERGIIQGRGCWEHCVRQASSVHSYSRYISGKRVEKWLKPEVQKSVLSSGQSVGGCSSVRAEEKKSIKSLDH